MHAAAQFALAEAASAECLQLIEREVGGFHGCPISPAGRSNATAEWNRHLRNTVTGRSISWRHPMNIQRFMLPASIAAAIHVALLWTVSGEPGPLRIKIMEVPLISDPLPKPDEPVVVAPEEKSDTMEPVKSLGGPTPPQAPEPEVWRKPHDASIPTPDKPIYPKEDTKIIPRKIGR